MTSIVECDHQRNMAIDETFKSLLAKAASPETIERFIKRLEPSMPFDINQLPSMAFLGILLQNLQAKYSFIDFTKHFQLMENHDKIQRNPIDIVYYIDSLLFSLVFDKKSNFQLGKEIKTCMIAQVYILAHQLLLTPYGRDMPDRYWDELCTYV